MYSLKELVDNKSLRKKKTILVGGTFDLLHVAHVKFLEMSKKYGDTLIVGIESDKRVKERKGNNRPILDEKQRAKMVASLKVVDHVFISNSSAYDHTVVAKLKPKSIVFALEKGVKAYRKGYKKIYEEKFPETKVSFVETGVYTSTTKIIETVLDKASQ